MGCNTSKAHTSPPIAEAPSGGGDASGPPILLTDRSDQRKPSGSVASQARSATSAPSAPSAVPSAVPNNGSNLALPTPTACSPQSLWPPPPTEPSPSSRGATSRRVGSSEAPLEEREGEQLEASSSKTIERKYLNLKVLISSLRGLQNIVAAANLKDSNEPTEVYCIVELPGKYGARCQTEVVQMTKGNVVDWDYKSEVVDFEEGDDLSFVIRAVPSPGQEPREDALGRAGLTYDQIRGGFLGEVPLLAEAGTPLDAFLKLKIEAPMLSSLSSRITEEKTEHTSGEMQDHTSIKPLLPDELAEALPQKSSSLAKPAPVLIEVDEHGSYCRC